MSISHTPTPAALMREAERLRHMAHRAARCCDLAPVGLSHERYTARLESQCKNMLARRAMLDS